MKTYYLLKFDKVELQLQVDTDMAWDNPLFALLAIKPDGNAVRQTDNYTTIEGTTKVQLITKDNGRQSTTIFSLVVSPSLDSNILEINRDEKVLDELEAYIAQGREVIAESEEIVATLKSEMIEFNQNAKSNNITY